MFGILGDARVPFNEATIAAAEDDDDDDDDDDEW